MKKTTNPLGFIAMAAFLAIGFNTPSYASGKHKPLCYSTGPLENEVAQSERVFVKVLNNAKHNSIKAKILVFSLNGTKILESDDEITVEPKSSDFVVIPTEDLVEFEAQVKLTGAAKRGLIGAFGKDLNGNLVPAHRLVHTEWTKISCKDFN